MTDMDHIEEFEGKRNSVITMFIPPNIAFAKNIDGIERSVKAIKHSNKRGQILKVIRCITENTKTLKKIKGNGLIICCGYTMQNEPEYYELTPPNSIKNFEYYYDYVFNVRRIREIFNEDVIISLNSEEEAQKLNELEKHTVDADNVVVIGDREIEEALKSKVIKELYHFSNDAIDNDIITKMRDIGAFIIKVDISIVSNRDFGEKYGNRIGLLYYPVDFS
jgi:peptide subunit release factor 1 (eRF1)